MQIKNGTRDQLVFWGSLVIVVLLIGLAVSHFRQFANWVGAANGWAPLVSMLLYIPLSLTPIPSDPLTVLNGGLFGVWFGMLVSWMGNNLAAMTEYWLFKRVGMQTKFLEKQHHLPKFLRRWPVNSPLFLIVTRFVPGFGGKMVSVLAGMYQVPLWRFVWTSAISNLAGSLLFAFGGFSLLKLI